MSQDSSISDEKTPGGGPIQAVADWVADLGGVVIDWLEGLGSVALFTFRTFSWLTTRMVRRETLLPSFYQIGVLSLPVVALTGTFIGIILAVQAYGQFRMLHMESRLGAVINLSLVRELGPVLAATMLAGRVGSAMAAELGHDARDRADRRPGKHGGQSDPLSRRAAIPRLPAADPRPDDHGRLHGHRRRGLL